MIEDFVPVGFENRISREYLRVKSGILNDRKMRMELDKAADRGVLVVSCNGGYFIPDMNNTTDVIKANEYRQKEYHRAMSILKRNNLLAKKIENEAWQYSVNLKGEINE